MDGVLDCGPTTISYGYKGLFEVLECALQDFGIPEVSAKHCKKLVGIGTDRASANIAANGLKGLVKRHSPWMFWIWCLTHRLELAVKDALKALPLMPSTNFC